MAGRFRALTCAQEPRYSKQDSPPLAACPQGSLSYAMAVPHKDSRRRKAAASPVLALLAASRELSDTRGVGAAACTVAGVAVAGDGAGVGAIIGRAAT